MHNTTCCAPIAHLPQYSNRAYGIYCKYVCPAVHSSPIDLKSKVTQNVSKQDPLTNMCRTIVQVLKNYISADCFLFHPLKTPLCYCIRFAQPPKQHLQECRNFVCQDPFHHILQYHISFSYRIIFMTSSMLLRKHTYTNRK